jgi:hypothetical protein
VRNLLALGGFVFLCSSISQATPAFVAGTPNFSNNNALSPVFGHVTNFDDAATVTNVINSGANFALPANYYASAGVASISDPSGLFVQPFSTQSGPNFLTNGNASINGEANITIRLANPVNAIGIGLADADGVPITLNLLGASGILATQTVMLPANTQNPFNAYYAFFDSSNDIFGLSIIQSTDLSGKFPSGLAIDDLQEGPEPASIALLTSGGLLLGFSLLRKRR